ncbi:MAG TPA: hypothetical protein PK152_02380 [Anaerolineales bacterium]|nr:hypothetical protein [Anaerolineales bacterium]HRK87954.1 hypothetical protein [Anaerolineales bacterium]
MTDSPANLLCKACGLCCSGHLFAWVRLDANELDKVEKLGLKVIRDDPRQRGFLQPCAVWDGTCTVYTSPDYPRSCARYKCKQFKELVDEKTSLPEAMEKIQHAHELIRELENFLPASRTVSFRERLLTKIEDRSAENAPFREKAQRLISYFEDFFGVMDFFD